MEHSDARIGGQSGITPFRPLSYITYPPIANRHDRALFDEYWAASRAMRVEDVHQLMGLGVPIQAIWTAAPAPAHIAAEGDLFQFDPDGAAAWVAPVCVVDGADPEEIETSDPPGSVIGCLDGAVIDLLAFHPAAPRFWALRRGAAAVLGAVPRQCDPTPPVPIHRDVTDWLRGRCRGLVLLTRDRYAAAAILRRLSTIVPEDEAHAAELRALLALPPRTHTKVLSPGEGGDWDDDEWRWRQWQRPSVRRAGATRTADRAAGPWPEV